jgi:hypothetical protein
VNPLGRSSLNFLSPEFNCRGCGAHEAYLSHPRGLFEKYLLPILFLRVVRCDRCYVRSYVPRVVSARERPLPPRKQPESQPATAESHDSRIA